MTMLDDELWALSGGESYSSPTAAGGAVDCYSLAMNLQLSPEKAIAQLQEVVQQLVAELDPEAARRIAKPNAAPRMTAPGVAGDLARARPRHSLSDPSAQPPEPSSHTSSNHNHPPSSSNQNPPTSNENPPASNENPRSSNQNSHLRDELA